MNTEHIKMICAGGPFGDETSNYNVETTCNTVREFIFAMLREKTGEWGSVYIQTLNDDYGTFGKYKLEYKYGKVYKDNIPNSELDKKIYEIKSNGGWSAMDYYIKTTDYKKEIEA